MLVVNGEAVGCLHNYYTVELSTSNGGLESLKGRHSGRADPEPGVTDGPPQSPYKPEYVFLLQLNSKPIRCKYA